MSIREGAGYDEVYSSGCEPIEDLTWSPEREPSAHSPAKEEEEEYEGDEEEGEEKDEEEEEGKDEKEGDGGEGGNYGGR